MIATGNRVTLESNPSTEHLVKFCWIERGTMPCSTNIRKNESDKLKGLTSKLQLHYVVEVNHELRDAFSQFGIGGEVLARNTRLRMQKAETNKMDYLTCLGKYIKKTEKIDQKNIHTDHNIVHIPVQKNAKRIMYKTKMIRISLVKPDAIPEVLKRSVWNSRKTLKELREFLKSSEGIVEFGARVHRWLEAGLLVSVQEYDLRGILRQEEHYLPSQYLEQYWEGEKKRRQQGRLEQLERYLDGVEALENPYEHVGFEIIREMAVREAKSSRMMTIRLDFLEALLRAASLEKEYDWKEIGLYSSLKATEKALTKVYDSRRKTLAGCVAAELAGHHLKLGDIGLTTHSGNYDISIMARCRIVYEHGEYDCRDAGIAYRITDEEAFRIVRIDRKDIDRLFLLENRANFRKIARTIDRKTLERTALIAFDGQIRMSQANLLAQFRASGVNHLIVWTDYDEYAHAMLNNLAGIGYERFEVLVPSGGSLKKLPLAEAVSLFVRLKGSYTLDEQENYLKDIGLITKMVWEESE